MKKISFYTSLVEQDGDDYLYELETETDHYYYTKGAEDGMEYGSENVEPRMLIERKDMNNEEWHIAKVLFHFLWTSENGTNTCMDYEQLEEEGITKEQVETFIEKFSLSNGLETYEEDGVEIYWDFLCSFDLKSCNFWEDVDNA